MDLGKNIQSVRERGLCISCGICAANCPENCITMERVGQEVLPDIDEKRCLRCGLCLKACSAPSLGEAVPEGNIERYLLGDWRELLSVQAKDRALLARCASGALVTQLVGALLADGAYGSAFLVEGYEYAEPPATRRFTAGDSLDETCGSRYLPVSHETAARYMIAHPSERVILVGTPCALRGLLNTMALHGLPREQYLLIGLFCERVMTLGVLTYFSIHPAARGRALRKLYFKTKAAGGWPGNLRLAFGDGSHADLPRSERIKAKPYFTPERCLYCVDKLNRLCDIAAGDNYIPEERDPLGVSCCIVRTELGAAAWERCRALFNFHAVDAEALMRSQHLNKAKQNLANACIKGLSACPTPIDARALKAYRVALRKIEIGRRANCYRAVERDILRKSWRGMAGRLARKLHR